jgi:hypothetical protein
MQREPFKTERTRAVDRLTRFRPQPATVAGVIQQFCERHTDGRALGVAVIDAGSFPRRGKAGMGASDGVRVRLAHGAGPLVLSVGRHGACDLALEQADASLRHVAVVADDDGVLVVDLGASFGVGDRRCAVGDAVAIRCGDSIVVACVVDGGSFGDAARAIAAAVATVDGPVPPLRLVTRADVARAHLEPLQRLPPLPLLPLPSSSPQPGPGRTLRLTGLQRRLLVGRLPRNDVVIEDQGVSRVHAVVVPVRSQGRRQAVIVDAGSTNGTTVLGIHPSLRRVCEVSLGPVQRGHVIDDGDLVCLCDGVRLRVVGSIDDEAGPGAHCGAGSVA